MRFRPPQTSPQWNRRVIGYVAVIAVVVVAFQLLPPVRRPADNAAAPDAASSLPDRLDVRLRQEPDSPLAPDEFRAPPDLDHRDQPQLPDVPKPVVAVNRANAEPQLDKSVLTAVRD
ncbi:MAG TPA: hypothetical protein VM165_10365, partial [Planctomycetaceae bacterium]|nr:hypothetical protein [Planctomycetaceae bacterium]